MHKQEHMFNMHNSLPRGLSWGDAERDRDAVEGREVLFIIS